MRSDEWLGAHAWTVGTTVDAKKTKFDRAAALKLARAATRVLAAKGAKIVDFEVTPTRPSDDELAQVLMGTSGNLRAPTLRTGATLLVGFHPDLYRDVLG